MTADSMYDIILPLSTQCNVLGAIEPSMAEPSTNSGNSDVSLDRITSMFATAAGGRRLVMEEDSVFEEEEDADDNDE
jgi:hypothetical protein